MTELIQDKFGINEELYNKYLNDVELFFQKLFPIEEERDIILTYNPFLFKNLLQFIFINELSKVDINFFIFEFKQEISKGNNELKDWIISIIEKGEDKKDSNDLIEKYRHDFPHDNFIKKKDLERMIKYLSIYYKK